MSSNSDAKLRLKGDVFAIVGAAIVGLVEFCHWLLKRIYHFPPADEFGSRQIHGTQQLQQFPMLHQGPKIGLFAPDFIAGKAVILAAGLRAGVTLHFKLFRFQ